MFHSRGRTGLNTKQITVSSNDPSEPAAVLTVKALLETALQIDPVQLDYGNLKRGQGATLSAQLAGRDAAKAKIVSVDVGGMRALHAAATPADRILAARIREGAHEIELTVPPDAPLGPFHGVLKVATDHPLLSSLTLVVHGYVRSSVEVRPERVRFRDDGSEQTRTVRLDGLLEEPVRVLEVTAENPAIRTSFAEIAPGQTEIRVTLDGTVAGSLQATTLTIRTSSTQDPVVMVPVEVRRASPTPPPAAPAPPAPPAGKH